MLPLTKIQPEGWPLPRGYSNGVLAPAGRRLLAVAGQIGWDATGQLATPDSAEDVFVTQLRQALRNVAEVVRAAGGDVSDVMSLRIYVTDKRRYLADSKAVGAAYREVFGRHFPAMALVQIQALVEDAALVEVEALAAIA